MHLSNFVNAVVVLLESRLDFDVVLILRWS